MVRILQGEFANSHETLDLTEEQGDYGRSVKGSKLRRNRTADPSHKDHCIYVWIRISKFHKLNFVNLVIGIVIFRYVISRQSRIVWGHRS
jgi:hypothetical protein